MPGSARAEGAASASRTQPAGKHGHLWLVLRGGLGSAEAVMTASVLFIYRNEKAASHIATELLDSPHISRKHEPGCY